jgi:benzoate membrane transport protein
VIGTFWATGALMLVLGLMGSMRRIMNLLPMPIVMAMVAGVFLQFGLNVIYAFRDGFWIALPMTAAFLLLTAVPRLGRVLPPLIGALAAGVVAVLALGQFNFSGAETAILARPNFYAPEFSLASMIELVVPLAITVLAAQNGQGFAVLEDAGHKAPVNAVTAACGLGSMVVALFGSVSTCLTGPVNAIIASGGEKERHYAAGVLVALLALLFGLFSPVFTRFMFATPGPFIAALAGLALVRILERAFVVSFSGSFTLGAAVTFLVTVANVPIFNIGAPFWGLVFGFAVSWLLERDAFRALAARNGDKPAADQASAGEKKNSRRSSK